MKGIYLTEEGKQEIEAKIAALDEFKQISNSDYEWNELVMEQNAYKKILSSAIILPVEESWEDINFNIFSPYDLITNYPDGIIIQPKL
jgi:hypothetical protein